jgi:hypothetical protein
MTRCGPVSSSGRTLLREVVEFLSCTLFSVAYFCILQVLSKAGLKSRDMNFSFQNTSRITERNHHIRPGSRPLSLSEIHLYLCLDIPISSVLLVCNLVPALAIPPFPFHKMSYAVLRVRELRHMYIRALLTSELDGGAYSGLFHTPAFF